MAEGTFYGAWSGLLVYSVPTGFFLPAFNARGVPCPKRAKKDFKEGLVMKQKVIIYGKDG